MARYGLPNIDIVFTQKAVTAVQRSKRGTLAIIVKDSKEAGVTKFVYRRATDVSKSDYETIQNYTDIQQAFKVAVNKVYVFRCNTQTEETDIVKELEKCALIIFVQPTRLIKMAWLPMLNKQILITRAIKL